MAKLVYFMHNLTGLTMQLIHDDKVSLSASPKKGAIVSEHVLTEAQARLPLNELRLIFKPRVRIPYRRG
jgi:hypothetical protein